MPQRRYRCEAIRDAGKARRENANASREGENGFARLGVKAERRTLRNRMRYGQCSLLMPIQRTAGPSAFQLPVTSPFNLQQRSLSPAAADLESR